MKKTSKPTAKKPAAKMPVAKKAPANKPTRKAEEQSHLALAITRLELAASTLVQIAERLGEIADHLAQLIPCAASAPAAEPPPHQPANEHADDVEVDLTPIGEGEE
jgi:hypothetical protein